MEKVAIVIVTFKRQELLEKLFESLLQLETAPWRIYVVDNEASPRTKQLVDTFAASVQDGQTAISWPSGSKTWVYAPQPENGGGAAGFSAGVHQAFQDGADWFWLMDDDVVAFPDALSLLLTWTNQFDAIQGSRLDFDGGPFWWQYHFVPTLGIYNPFASSSFPACGWKPATALCFEGAFFNRFVVKAVGLPDARFFLYWDDCVYGYLASRHLRVAVIQDCILKRSREIQNWEVSGVRQLNSSSDRTRYCVMKNRGHMAKYLQAEGVYNSVLFGLGTIASFAKEFIRLLAVDQKQLKTGTKSLFKGWRDARTIMADKSWKPYKEMMPVESDTFTYKSSSS